MELSRYSSIRRKNENPQDFPNFLSVFLCPLRQGVLNMVTIDIFKGIILCCGAALCIVRCLLAPLKSLDAKSLPPPGVTTNTLSLHCHISPGWKNHPYLRTTNLAQFKNKSLPHKHLYMNVHSIIHNSKQPKHPSSDELIYVV